MSQFTPNHSLIGKRKTMMNVFEFLNTNGLRIFGFSGQEGNFIKTLMEKSDCLVGGIEQRNSSRRRIEAYSEFGQEGC